MSPLKLLQLKSSWERFAKNHPKFPRFLSGIYQKSLREGTLIEFKVTTPDGEKITANIKIKADDMALFDELRGLFQ